METASQANGSSWSRSVRLFFKEKPIAKTRPRFNSKTKRAYSNQSNLVKAKKWEIAKQMREKGFERLVKQPLHATLTSYIPFPRSWTESRKNSLLGHPCITKPDTDNVLKFYCDVLNRIAYEDDAHICSLWGNKIYAHEGGVKINITPLVGDLMIQEHAKTIEKEISMVDLEYLIKKAHKIGLSGRQLTRVYAQEDEEGKHIYFECQCMKSEQIPKSFC